MRNILILVLLYAGGICAQTNIVEIEYWIDTDPGFSNATAVVGVDMTSDTAIQFTIPADLSAGLHTLGVRSRSDVGIWSQTQLTPLYIKDSTSSTLTSVEYFWDSDPGYGNGESYGDFTVGKDIALQFELPTDIVEGFHQIGIRTIDSRGVWGETNFIPVYVSDSTTVVLTEIEYFWNIDPGYDQAKDTLLASPEVDLTAGWLYAEVPDLALNKLHTLFVRSRDNRGMWGHTNYIEGIEVTDVIDAIELLNVAKINVFPNPFADHIQIESMEQERVRVLIYSASGQLAVDRSFDHTTVINTSALPTGTYFMLVWTDVHQIFRTTIVKQ